MDNYTLNHVKQTVKTNIESTAQPNDYLVVVAKNLIEHFESLNIVSPQVFTKQNPAWVRLDFHINEFGKITVVIEPLKVYYVIDTTRTWKEVILYEGYVTDIVEDCKKSPSGSEALDILTHKLLKIKRPLWKRFIGLFRK
jgi:hypothetical protein